MLSDPTQAGVTDFKARIIANTLNGKEEAVKRLDKMDTVESYLEVLLDAERLAPGVR